MGPPCGGCQQPVHQAEQQQHPCATMGHQVQDCEQTKAKGEGGTAVQSPAPPPPRYTMLGGRGGAGQISSVETTVAGVQVC